MDFVPCPKFQKTEVETEVDFATDDQSAVRLGAHDQILIFLRLTFTFFVLHLGRVTGTGKCAVKIVMKLA
jgi:hypothetical protein